MKIRTMLAALVLLMVPGLSSAKTRNVYDRYQLTGVCADFEDRYVEVSLHFCAKTNRAGAIFYYISINVTSTSQERLVIQDHVLNVKQAISKREVPLRFEGSTVVIVSEDPKVFLKSYIVEVPEIIIKHIRNGIPVDFSFVKAGKKYEFKLNQKERSEIRMVALLDTLKQEK